MKKIITIIALAFVAFAASAQKVGHVNAQALMLALPDYKIASDELNRFAESKKAELQMWYTAFQTAQKEFEEALPTLTEEIKQQRYEELMEKQQNIQAKDGEFQQEVALKEQKLVEPIMKKVRDAVAKVAKDGGYSYVFDESTLMYFAEAESLDAKVKKELGIVEVAGE
ncbi:MAG: OmpH family outer membrane protein [Flavobacteriales bacterium]|jgi:outer membrane protein|nr:OmpH family outer membrane protein [Flavobacteriales bacterium]